MKLTLDRMCIQTKKLCQKCIKLMDDGDISDIDIQFGQILMTLAKSNRYLNDLTILKIIPTSKNVFIIIKKGQLNKIDKAEELIYSKFSQFSEKRNIIYLEKTKSAKTLIESLIAPIKPINNSIVIIPPDGTKELKIQIKSNDKKKLLISASETSKLTKSILGMDTHFVYI